MRSASRKSMASSFSLSMSVWFCVPEQGMREMEILCRSSAFVVPSLNKKFGKSFHIVTCSHVASPWLWPKYYNQDWLKAVDHRHVFYTVEVRHEDGVFATQIDLLARSYHHSFKDLSVLHFENEESACSDLQVAGFEALNIQNKKFNDEDLLDFQGHDVFGDDLIPIPQNIPGVFSYSTNRQNFFKTANVLTSGMCGGPVVSKERIHSPSSPATTLLPTSNQLIKCSNSFQVRGMVEGIIPTNYSDENLKGNIICNNIL